ncbi:hypothetical protein JMUB6875_44330 [Nocardia sp. JMUB6875]|uniref:hypothetical protein n=1 Tax=Nocardia sp. JMUB6875 TaxID=3158170 RepID=UPI0032E53BA3
MEGDIAKKMIRSGETGSFVPANRNAAQFAPRTQSRPEKQSSPFRQWHIRATTRGCRTSRRGDSNGFDDSIHRFRTVPPAPRCDFAGLGKIGLPLWTPIKGEGGLLGIDWCNVFPGLFPAD